MKTREEAESEGQRILRVLIVEDSADDALLTARELDKGGYAARCMQVSTSETMRDALSREPWDLVISDYRMPGFSATAALRIHQESGQPCPFVLVSGAVGEETAVALLKAGADDYVLKSHLARLVPAVERSLRNRELREKERRTEAALIESEERFRRIFEESPVGMLLADRDHRFTRINPSLSRMLGYFEHELLGLTFDDIIVQEEARADTRSIGRLWSGDLRQYRAEKRYRRKDSSVLWGMMTVVMIRNRQDDPLYSLTMIENISDRKDAEAALLEAEARYRALFERAGDAIVVVDPDSGALVEFNGVAHGSLGYSREELASLKWWEIGAVHDASNVSSQMKRVLAEGGGSWEAQYRRKDGSIREVLVNCRPVAIRGTTCVHAIWSDITDIKRMEHDLRAAVGRLEELDRARSEFVSNVSHELKTPLASILHGTRNLLNGVAGALPDPVLHYARIIDGEARRLLKTISDILDMRQLESRRLQLTKIRIPFARLVARRCEAMRAQAEEKKLRMSVVADRECGFAECDPQKIERVIHNVLGNAIKFTPSGGELRIAVLRDPESEQRLLFTVEDTGVGIPSEAMPHIAERYFRAGNNPSGSGLGLAISKEILKLHDGEIDVKSPPPGKEAGTLVRVRLPAAEPSVVLLVDEDQVTRTIVEDELAHYGFMVRLGGESVEELVARESDRPDCVVVNVTRNWETAFRLKCGGGSPGMPVVGISSHELDGVSRQIMTEMAIPVLSRPHEWKTVVDTVEEELFDHAVFVRRSCGKGERP